MKVAHLCLSCFYIDGYSYQENEIVRQNILDGHDVIVIAATETYTKDRKLGYVSSRKYIGNEGAPVERVAYKKFLSHGISRKLRRHPDIYGKLTAFNPDVILFHGACGAEIETAARYVRDNPHVKLYVDSHEDRHNSATNFLSKWGLHYLYYRPILLRALPYIEKILPVSISCVEFIRDFYGVPEDHLEFYPLGGHVPDDAEYTAMREQARKDLGLAGDEILIVQSGKFDRPKKLLQALRCFSQTDDKRLRFVVVGHLYEEVEDAALALVDADKRILFVSWKTSDELQTILCGADVYCQPGTQSATMQMAISCRCAIILDDVASHKPYHKENGWLVTTEADLKNAFSELSSSGDVTPMEKKSHALALQMLDYRKIAARLYR